MNKSSLFLVAALTSSALVTTVFAGGRNHIEVVGSSTVYPFATVVAETDVHIMRLRKTLKKYKYDAMLKTIHGVGYHFECKKD